MKLQKGGRDGAAGRGTMEEAKIKMAKAYQIVLAGSSWGVRNTFHSLVAILTTLVVITTIYLRQDGGHVSPKINASSSNSSSSSKCDLFSGKWVFDNESYPLYKEKECTFMSDQLACEKFGRKDLSYQNWRWQPHHCNLPRFNATALLERLRNKRLVFVGDSLNRGQWASMVCLVDSILPKTLKSMHSTANGSLNIFKAKDYNATIEHYWSPLLVESNSDDPVNHRVPERTVRVKAIEKHARYWTDADFLVFNTYLWWRRPVMNVLWGSFGDPDGVYKGVEMLRVYEMALRTWSDWLEVHVNRNKTHLFFVSMSPTHERAEEWRAAKGNNCYSETDMIAEEGYWGKGSDPKMMHVVENVIDDLKARGLNVQMLNITQLSEYRKEGHPSIYRKQWDALTQEQIANPNSYADCIHWCLPAILISTLLVVTTICLRQDRGQLSQKINAPSDSSSSKCDLFSGKWVFDNESYPLYKEQQCTFMSDELACEKFGRKDLSYQNWRRKPHQYCDLPRFNATALLKRLRNKRLVFVGDSLIRGQWVSMICLVDSILPSTLKSMHSTANESNSDDPVNHKVPERTVRVKAIGKHARWGSFGDPDGVYKGVEMLRVYGMALRTWFDWLEVHVNRNKTHLFFVSMSPIHESAEEWGAAEGNNCYSETDMIAKEGYWGDLILK
ncbi:Protein trichome birefringence-like 34 [Glycine max]|nr:Protein trichome birefringence-like 34 [Glycine max]